MLSDITALQQARIALDGFLFHFGGNTEADRIEAINNASRIGIDLIARSDLRDAMIAMMRSLQSQPNIFRLQGFNDEAQAIEALICLIKAGAFLAKNTLEYAMLETVKEVTPL